MTQQVKTASPLRDAPIGYGTILGTVAAVLSAAGTVVAAVNDNDFATAAAGAALVVSIFETLNGRFAQAVAKIRQGVVRAGPAIDAAQERIATSAERSKLDG